MTRIMRAFPFFWSRFRSRLWSLGTHATSQTILVFLFLALLAWIYLLPISRLSFTGEFVIGNGADDLPQPFYIWWVRHALLWAPWTELNGALFTPMVGAPQGYLVWVPYMERIFNLFLAPFFSPDQTELMLVFCYYVFSGILSFWVARRAGLRPVLALALATAFAFTPFVYWRSFQHPALVGTFFVPLAVLAHERLFYARQKRDYFWAGVFLFLIGFSAHYYVLIFLTLAPFLWLHLGLHLAKKHRFKKPLFFCALAFLPLGFLLVWTKIGTPLSVENLRDGPALFSGARPLNPTGAWDVLVYSAKPLDYLSGNFDSHALELNPIRGWINQVLRNRYGDQFYIHEHSAGVRWLLLILTFFSLFHWKKWEGRKKQIWVTGAILILVGYVFSLSPRAFSPLGIGIAPSKWVNLLIPEMRAPNRWCVLTHLGFALCAFLYLEDLLMRLKKWRFQKVIPWLALGLVILEFPPTFNVPYHAVLPRFQKPSPCGLGVFLPYGYENDEATLKQIASLRETDCKMVNGQQTTTVDHAFYKILHKPLENASESKKLLTCLGVEWVDWPEASSKNCSKIGYEYAFEGRCQQGRQERAALQKENPKQWSRCVTFDINK